MQKKMRDFALKIGLSITDNALEKLALYADLVWQKKDFLNLTSVCAKQEIFSRHLCDGLSAAAFLNKKTQGGVFSVADMGSGAGYIGLTIAITLPQVKVTLVESLEKRCSFMNWAILKLGLQNVTVSCTRLGQKEVGTFDFVTERAMGQINDILPLIAPCVKEGGFFIPYQSDPHEAKEDLLTRLNLSKQTPVAYTLPEENKERFLAVFQKEWIS